MHTIIQDRITNHGLDVTEPVREIREMSAFLCRTLPTECEIRCLIRRGIAYIDLAAKEKKIFGIAKKMNSQEVGAQDDSYGIIKMKQYITNALNDFVKVATKFTLDTLRSKYDWLKSKAIEGIKKLISAFRGFGPMYNWVKEQILEKIRSEKAGFNEMRIQEEIIAG